MAGVELGLAALALTLLILLVIVVRDAHGGRRDLEKTRTRAAEAEAANLNLRSEVERLGRYRTILDAESFAADLRAQAAQSVEAARTQVESERTLARAELSAAELQRKATEDAARASAAEIVERAQDRARQIAGEALALRDQTDSLRRTATALKNVVEGYGDEYVVPTTSLLDDLASEFGYTEAGQTLKEARDQTKAMIRTGKAADCDYVEPNRRATAIAFVLDAFNGKVDSILADTRHDNHGTLAQKIQDAFHLVNHNGDAFRAARILPGYLESRLNELKWATVAHELRLREKEEQRVLREQIREEERAQKEYEKAMRDARKEEDLITKALEKARREAEAAGDTRRAEYEAKLAELTEQLRLAEEKNQRALSMAQQTRAGHVYVISNIGSFGEDVFKVGLTRRLEPLDRVKELGDASVPFDFDVPSVITQNRPYRIA